MATNDIVNAITIKLHSMFGDVYTYYTEDVKQGMSEPCFFVQLIEPIHSPLLGVRRKMSYSFDIVCILPEDTEDLKNKLNDIMDDLYVNMEFIQMLNGDQIRGIDMHSEIIDGVLHFFIKYNLVLIKVEDLETMDDLQLDSGLKG